MVSDEWNRRTALFAQHSNLDAAILRATFLGGVVRPSRFAGRASCNRTLREGGRDTGVLLSAVSRPTRLGSASAPAMLKAPTGTPRLWAMRLHSSGPMPRLNWSGSRTLSAGCPVRGAEVRRLSRSDRHEAVGEFLNEGRYCLFLPLWGRRLRRPAGESPNRAGTRNQNASSVMASAASPPSRMLCARPGASVRTCPA